MNRSITILSEAVTDQSEVIVKVCFEAREKGWEYLMGRENKTMKSQGLLLLLLLLQKQQQQHLF